MADQNTPQSVPFRLRGIYLSSSSIRISDNVDPLIDGIAMHANFRIADQRYDVRDIEISRGETKSKLTAVKVTTRFEFRYNLARPVGSSLESLPDDNILAELSAEIVSDYEIDPDNDPGKDFISQWAAKNVVLHVWPYWREFCSSTLQRMNLPVIHMPMVVLDPLVSIQIKVPGAVSDKEK